MKRWIIVLVLVLVGSAISVAGFLRREGHGAAPPDLPQAQASAVIEVNDYMRHPENHPGVVSVQGVVSVVDPEKHLLTLIDRSEWEECGVVSCASLSLPVLWNGTMPRAEEGTLVRGQTREVEGKLLFVAESLEPIALKETAGS